VAYGAGLAHPNRAPLGPVTNPGASSSRQQQQQQQHEHFDEMERIKASSRAYQWHWSETEKSREVSGGRLLGRAIRIALRPFAPLLTADLLIHNQR
jgi:hypothetical protein